MSDDGKIGLEIPLEQIEQTLVACPLVGNDLRPVKDCFSCEHYATVKDKMPGDRKAREFHQRYVLGCKYPTARPLFKLTRPTDAGTE